MSSGTAPPADTRSWFQRLGDEYLVIQRQNMGRMGRLTPDTVGITLPPEDKPTVDAAKLADDLTPDILKDATVQAYAKAHPAQFATAITAGAGQLLGKLIEVALRPVYYAQESLNTTLRPGIPELLDLQTQNIDLDSVAADYYQKQAEGFGLSKYWWDKLVKANGTIPAVSQLLDLLNRQTGNQIRGKTKYTYDYVRSVLLKSPLKDEFIDDIMELRFQIPPASDAVRFAVKDAFSKDPAVIGPRDAEFPDTLTPYLVAQGYREEDAKYFWRAHYDLPSPTQVFEMLHRGVKTPTTVAQYLAQADYAPEWRAPLEAISYNPITRTDAKRAFKLGLGGFDEKRLQKAYQDLGYTPVDAALLVEFTKLDVGEEARQERELLVGPIRTAALKMFAARRIDAIELRRTLANLKYTPEIIERYIADIEFARVTEQRDDIAAALKGAYVKALRSRDDTRALLIEHGYSGEAADDVLAPWDILRQTTELNPKQVADRDLTRADIEGAWADSIISEADFTGLIRDLGYDETEADVIVRRAIIKRDRAERADIVDLVRSLYVSGQINLGEANIRLDAAGVPAISKRAQLQRFLAEREKRIPDFPIKLIEDLTKAKVIDYLQSSQYLSRQGYTAEQRDQLLRFWGARADDAAAKAGAGLAGAAFTRLSRRDYEDLYRADPKKRQAAIDGLKSIGYSQGSAEFVLDGVDRGRPK